MDIASAFRIPTHRFGLQPERRRVSPENRGRQELAYIRAFESANPGVHVRRSADAARVEMDELLRNLGIE